MKFDLIQFLTRSTVPASRDFVLECSEQDFFGYRLACPCDVKFTAEHKADKAVLKISFCVKVEAECARCLEAVGQEFELSQEYLVGLDELQQEDCELPILGCGMLDLNELARTEMELQLPQIFLCDEQCKGLCPVCGKPRKLGCSCEIQQADERLSVFEQLLS